MNTDQGQKLSVLIRVHPWFESVFSFLSFAALITMPLGAQTAKQGPPGEKPMVLTEAIPLENAKGRFDHFAMAADAFPGPRWAAIWWKLSTLAAASSTAP